MKNIFLIIMCLFAYKAQADSKQCISIEKVGSNIEISIKETNGEPFVIGTSDIYFNTGGLSYTLAGGISTTSFPLVLTNITASSLLAPYTVEVFQLSPNSLVVSVVQNTGASKTIGSSSSMIASIPFSGTGTPFLTKGNIYNSSSVKIAELCSAPVLPLELLSFKAERNADKSHVSWETTKEKDLEYYGIERSIDGKNFKTIGFEKPKARTVDEKMAYSFVDEKPDLGINYYRLLMKDLDGKERFSKVVSVDFGSKIKAKTFPNPFSYDLNIEIDIEKNIKGEVTIELFDMVGKQILTKKVVAEGRRLSFILPTEDLVHGTYLILMKNGKDTWQQKITKQ